MSQTIPIADVREFMTHHLMEVFETMLSLKARPASKSGGPQLGDRITGSVGFAGETVTGAVYVHLSTPFANQAAAAMLGLPPEETAGESDVNDVVGEIANMLTGGLKSWLCDAGAECAVSTPAIIRGTAFDVEPVPDVQRECVAFDCNDDRFFVEIHIKFN